MKKPKVYAVATRQESGKFTAAAVDVATGATPKFSRGNTREEALGKALSKGRIYYCDQVVEKDLVVAESRERHILVELRGEYVASANL
jgi:hypothetical protein